MSGWGYQARPLDGGRTGEDAWTVWALESFRLQALRRSLPMITGRDTSWKAMLGKDERDATEEEIAALEAEHGPFLPADGEG